MARKVQCSVPVIATGEALQGVVAALKDGRAVRVSGFISRTSYRDESCKLVLHAQSIELL